MSSQTSMASDMKGRDLDGTGFVLDRRFALDDLECPDILDEGIQS